MSKLRWLVALVVLAAFSFLFLLPAAPVLAHLGFLPRLQFVPALFAGSVLTVVAWLAVTALFGRLYCSLACPFGILQDLFRAVFTLAPFRKGRLPRKDLLSPRARWAVRLAFLVLFVVLCILGFALWLEPYGTFGRLLSLAAAPRGPFVEPSYGDFSLLVAALTAGVWAIALLGSLVCGRFWCNTVCPVGTLLALLARRALFRIRIDSAACVSCNLCARACPNGCIPADGDKRVDGSRCVTCFSCVGTCRKGALRYGRK